VTRNVARGRRTRESLERRRPREMIDVDEFLSLLHAAIQLDRERHRPATLARAADVRLLRDDAKLEWAAIAKQLGLARSTAFYLHACRDELTGPIWGARRPVIATLALAGPRVTELCQLNVDDLDLAQGKFYVNGSKTSAGVRGVDIHPRLLEELTTYAADRPPTPGTAPAFPTRTGNRRNKDNIRLRVIAPVVARANEIRAAGPAPGPRPRHSTHLQADLHHVHDRRRLRPLLRPGADRPCRSQRHPRDLCTRDALGPCSPGLPCRDSRTRWCRRRARSRGVQSEPTVSLPPPERES